MNKSFIILLVAVYCLITNYCAAQSGRVFGAGALQLDNNTSPIRTIVLQAPLSLTNNYRLWLPSLPPSSSINVLVSDINGQMSWASSLPLPSLPVGNIWVGDNASVATPFAPIGPGAVLTLDAANKPSWSYAIPAATTITVSQLTSGTLQPGVVLSVGPGATIENTGGTIVANSLNGAGAGKYSGSIPIPLDALNLTILYSSIQNESSVVVTIKDPGLPGVQAFVENITPGVGFKVVFSAMYPTATGVLSYSVVNP